jgi:hypothetical protein
VDWESNLKKCCSIGMTPIAIENDYTKSCIDELAKRKFLFLFGEIATKIITL